MLAQRPFPASRPSWTVSRHGTALDARRTASSCGPVRARSVCTLQIGELMPVREPFEAEAARLGEALLDGECPNGTDTDRALAEPVSHPRQLDASSGACPTRASARRSCAGSPFPHRGRRSADGDLRPVAVSHVVGAPGVLRFGPRRSARARRRRASRYGVPGRGRRGRAVRHHPVGLPLARVVATRELPRLRAVRALAFPYPESFERQLGDRVTKRLKSLAGRPAPDSLGGSRIS